MGSRAVGHVGVELLDPVPYRFMQYAQDCTRGGHVHEHVFVQGAWKYCIVSSSWWSPCFCLW